MSDKAAKAIIAQNGKVLILKQIVDSQAFYTLPGGRIQSANYEAELIREVKEETSLDVVVDRYLTNWSFTRKNGCVTECKIYICKSLTSDLSSQNAEKEENIQDLLWLTSDEINSKSIAMSDELKKIITTILNV